MALNVSLADVKVAPDRKVKGEGKARIFTEAELMTLFDSDEGLPTARDRFLFGLCYFSGARISEVLALTMSDIDGNRVTYRSATTKTKENRQALMNAACLELMSRYQLSESGVMMPEQGALFPGRHGRGHMTRFAANDILEATCKRLGLDGASTHSFRRSFITHMFKAGHTPAGIAKYTGHKNLSVLIGYIGDC
jgi:integrase/recombinase XerD